MCRGLTLVPRLFCVAAPANTTCYRVRTAEFRQCHQSTALLPSWAQQLLAQQPFMTSPSSSRTCETGDTHTPSAIEWVFQPSTRPSRRTAEDTIELQMRWNHDVIPSRRQAAQSLYEYLGTSPAPKSYLTFLGSSLSATHLRRWLCPLQFASCQRLHRGVSY